MLDLDDKRWEQFKGGYGTPFDPRPFLENLRANRDVARTWHELWGRLHHQGRVGEASYAVVPHLVRIYRDCGIIDWNTYAIVAVIELARGRRGNPDVPEEFKKAYDEAIKELAQLGLIQLPFAKDKETLQAILGILAIWKGARVYGRVLVEFTEDELVELEEQRFGKTESV